MQKLTEMIDALVAEKTISLEGVKAIEAVRLKGEQLQTELESVTKERDTAVLARDAARYRFWRSHWTADDEADFDKLNDILGKVDTNTPAQVDAALDAAMASLEIRADE